LYFQYNTRKSFAEDLVTCALTTGATPLDGLSREERMEYVDYLSTLPRKKKTPSTGHLLDRPIDEGM